MKIEDQVCSLELSQRLKELGVKQESLFDYLLFSDWDIYLAGKNTEAHYRDCVSAFTVPELVEMLPEKIILNDKVYGLIIHKHDLTKSWKVECYHVEYYHPDAESIYYIKNTLIEALAKMLICLLEIKQIRI